jgi:hypothetical protein
VRISRLALLALGLALTLPLMAIEEPAYETLERDGALELRRVTAHLVAETTVDSSFKGAGNEGFRRLVRYISGANRSQQKIAMTAPVSQSAGGEKIAMTAPVAQAASGNGFRVSFMLPAAYTLENAPLPDDQRIDIREVPTREVAVVRYSGTWSERRYREREQALLGWLEARGLSADGPAEYARYNSPFSLPFLRRNEIIVPVAAPSTD